MKPNSIQTKATAIAKLKNGVSIKDTADELDISAAIVKEWYEDLTTDDMVSKELNAIAINKASELLQSGFIVSQETLKSSLSSMAVRIIEEVNSSMAGTNDYETVKTLNLSANTIAQLQKAFFPVGTQIAIVGDVKPSSELNKFRDSLRD